MSTTAAAAASSDIRATDWAWAQRALAEMQADTHLQQLAQKWQSAATAISQAEDAATEYDSERGQAIAQLISIGHALQQLGQPVRTQPLEFLWEHSYTPMPTDPAELAALDALHLRIFGTPRHAA